MEKKIELNVDNSLYPKAKKRAYEMGIVFDEYLWRLINADLKGQKKEELGEIIDRYVNKTCNHYKRDIPFICGHCMGELKKELGLK